MVLLDVEKAFDKVWIAGLISKLINYGYPMHIIHLIQSYLTNRAMYVKINNAHSELKGITSRVPQGSVLGLILVTSLQEINFLILTGSKLFNSTLCMLLQIRIHRLI